MEHCCTNIIAACFTLPSPPLLLHHHLHLQSSNCSSETEIKCTWGTYLIFEVSIAGYLIFEIGSAKYSIFKFGESLNLVMFLVNILVKN